MKVYAQTERLILREILPTDEKDIFALDADPEVHKYLGNQPVTSIQQSREMIAYIRQQYLTNGIGRWAAIEKETNKFIGWAGLKYLKEEINHHTNFYDVGYRLILEFWGKGYATEAGRAALDYAFKVLKLPVVYGLAHHQNLASRHVLEKLGLIYKQTFTFQGQPTDWFEITRPGWFE